MADFDFGDIAKLSADLGKVSDEVVENVVKAVAVTSNRTKKSWQQRLAGSSTLPGLPSAVTYTVTRRAAEVEGEVGFEKRGQGALGNISEYGSPTVAPRGFGLASLEENTEDFVRGIERAVDDALKDGGL